MMRRPTCQRWIALADAKALGEAISNGDAAFASAHEVDCRSCADEARLWRSVSKIVLEPTERTRGRGKTPVPHAFRLKAGERALDQSLDSSLGSLPRWIEVTSRHAVRPRNTWSAMVMIAAAAGAVLVSGAIRHPPHVGKSALGGLAANEARTPPVSAEAPVLDLAPSRVAGPAAVLEGCNSQCSPAPEPSDAPQAESALEASKAETVSLAPKASLALGSALRTRGDLDAAARAYEDVNRQTPKSKDGRRALALLGDLRLNDLHDPRGALAAFDTYLAQGCGDRRRQVAFGRIEALRALGRNAEARAATKAFAARYPNASELSTAASTRK